MDLWSVKCLSCITEENNKVARYCLIIERVASLSKIRIFSLENQSTFELMDDTIIKLFSFLYYAIFRGKASCPVTIRFTRSAVAALKAPLKRQAQVKRSQCASLSLVGIDELKLSCWSSAAAEFPTMHHSPTPASTTSVNSLVQRL